MVYDLMAESYDYIFPKKEQTLTFLQEYLPQGHLLDVACATGEYAIALASDQCTVKGIDLSKPMIEKAKRKAAKAKVSVDFEQGRMEDIEETFLYEGAYCIGNSLVHLPTEESIGEFFQKLYKALKNGGKVVFQTVNYDRIYRYRITELPTIEHPKVTFDRTYTLHEDKVEFHTKLTTADDVIEDSVSLYPLQSRQMVRLLKNAGFQNISLHDGFSTRPFSKDESFALVVTAQKEKSGS